jgi:hypothetical protein
MGRFKVIGLMMLIGIFLVVVGMNDALAGEKVKVRVVKHDVKSQAIDVPGIEGQVLVSYEDKGISTNMGGKPIWEGWLDTTVGLWESNSKAGVGSGYGYAESTDQDGDKILRRWEGKKAAGDPHPRGTTTVIKGTGKWEGIKGTGTWVTTPVATTQSYVDVDFDIELPSR